MYVIHVLSKSNFGIFVCGVITVMEQLEMQNVVLSISVEDAMWICKQESESFEIETGGG